MNDCLFCKIINKDILCYTIYETETILAFLDINPCGTGHTLVIPKKHYVDYEDIPLEVLDEINKIGKMIYKNILDKLKPIGIRIVQHNGVCQEIKHYHLHLIPIYKKEIKKKLAEVQKLLA